MAIKHSITLSTTEPNNEVGVIKIRQADEQTQTLEVQITENGVPKSYQGLDVYFCAKLGQTAGLGIIEQKLKPEEMTNPANGKLEYTMRAEDWQILGRQRGYFSFKKMKDEHEFVEQFTTRDFTFDVIKSVYSDGLKEVKKDGSTYVWTIEDMIRLFKEYISTGKIDWENYKNDERTLWEKYRLDEKLNWEDYKSDEKNIWSNYRTGEKTDWDNYKNTEKNDWGVYKDKETAEWEQFVEQNRDVLESVDPGGTLISELIRSRKPFGADVPYKDVPERLDKQIGLNSDFREFEADESFMKRVFNEESERGVNVKWFGAVGDGVTDDTIAIQSAINFAKTKNYPVFLPNEKYRITSTVDARGVTIQSEGEIIVAFNGVGLLIGHLSTQGHLRKNYIKLVSHTNFIEGDISVRIVGAKYLEFELGRMEHLMLYADGDDSTISSIAYCMFYVLGFIKKLTVLSKKNAIGRGWINENTFIKGKFEKIIFDGNYHHNKNTFIDSCLERSEIEFFKGTNNHFRTARNESIKSIVFHEGTYRNSFEFAYYSSNGRLTWNGINDMGTGNTVYSVDDYAKTVKILDLTSLNVEDCSASIKENITKADGRFTVPAWKKFVEFELPATTFYMLSVAVKEFYNRGFRYTVTAIKNNTPVKDIECLIVNGSQFNPDTGEYKVTTDVKQFNITNKSYKNFDKVVVAIESSLEIHVQRLLAYAKAANNKMEELELIKPIF